MNLLKATIFVLVIVLLTACKEKVGNFIVQPPVDWVVRDTGSAASGKFINMHAPATSSKLEFIENISISIVKSPSLDFYIKYVSNSVEEDAAAFKQLGKGEIKINGYNFKWILHLIKNKDGELIEQKGYFTKNAGNIYQIVYTTRGNEQDKYKKELEEVLQSFKIL